MNNILDLKCLYKCNSYNANIYHYVKQDNKTLDTRLMSYYFLVEKPHSKAPQMHTIGTKELKEVGQTEGETQEGRGVGDVQYCSYLLLARGRRGVCVYKSAVTVRSCPVDVSDVVQDRVQG